MTKVNSAERGGLAVGPSHKEGGIPGVIKHNGQAIEFEGEEVIITAPAVLDNKKREFEGKMLTNRQILSHINRSGGGVAFNTFQAFLRSLTDEQIIELKNGSLAAMAAVGQEFKSNVLRLETERSQLNKKRQDLYDKEQGLSLDVSNSNERISLNDMRMGISKEISVIDIKIQHAKNIEKCFSNGGSIIEFEDKRSLLNNNIPSFIKINTSIIVFNEETILAEDIPPYIPLINERIFEIKGYVFDAIRIDKDTYIVAVNGYNEKVGQHFDYKSGNNIGGEHPSTEQHGYVLVTLDQLVLINDYYYTKAKALSQKKADESTQKNLDYYDQLPQKRREDFLNQKGYYHSLPAAVKKNISQVEYEALDLEGKEKLYKPYKKVGPKRLVSKLEDNHMWISFHNMYERFIDPTKVAPKKGYAHHDVFEYWRRFRDMMEFKIKDIKIQREVDNEQYKKAIETSFGDINTNDILFSRFGILVKRQDGKKIDPTQIEQIEKAWTNVQKVFGNMAVISKETGLKISHTNQTNVFASKAIGSFISNMRTIAVSAKYGDEQFNNTIAHEASHYIDNHIGKVKGKRWATDDYESSAGILAFEFRRLLNKRSDSDYINATKECFARALQQFFAITIYGNDAQMIFSNSPLKSLTYYFTEENYVSKESYYGIIKPLVERFLAENIMIITPDKKFPMDTHNEIRSEFGFDKKPDEFEKGGEIENELIVERSPEDIKKDISELVKNHTIINLYSPLRLKLLHKALTDKGIDNELCYGTFELNNKTYPFHFYIDLLDGHIIDYDLSILLGYASNEQEPYFDSTVLGRHFFGEVVISTEFKEEEKKEILAAAAINDVQTLFRFAIMSFNSNHIKTEIISSEEIEMAEPFNLLETMEHQLSLTKN